MDLPELIKIISNRIQKLEPENALKIVGCLFLKEPGQPEIFQLAICPDNVLHSKITDAKKMLNVIASKTAASPPVQAITDPPHNFNSFPQAMSRSLSSPATIHVRAPYLEPLLFPDQQPPMRDVDFIPHPCPDSLGDEYSPCNQTQFFFGKFNQTQFLCLEDKLNHANPMAMGPNFSNSCYYHNGVYGGGLTSRTSRRSPSLPEFPIKACHYFHKGYCKHGTNCRYFHGQSLPECYPQVFIQNMNPIEEQGFSSRSLQKLEVEITELLKSKNGPISIASLPMVYYEKYGRNLQAEGYLTESQRHGKAGFSLTKLLACLKNNIRLIDRPHGQRCIVLAEDEPGYMASRNERNDSSALSVSSHQIYLTFPAESTFNEEHVAQYFRQFGLVHDVRIPCQDKRMFGFVSFIYPETVISVLSKRNPHYICNARVLVKPYREKSRITDRGYMERVKHAMYLSSQCLEIDPELHSLPRYSESRRSLEKELFKEQENMRELERRRLPEFSMRPKPLSLQTYFMYNTEDFRVREGPTGPNELPMADHFSYILDAIKNGMTAGDKATLTSNSYNDRESNQIELPDSPFASPPVESSISAVI